MQKQKLWVQFLLPLASVFSAVVLALLMQARAGPVMAATGTNQQLNYQARLLDSTGGVVPDGLYNIEFKIYQDGDGVLGGGDETLMWTETRVGANTVTVKNGYFSVYLGSVTPFSTNVDWNQDTLWLSVNIGGTGTPSYDGEMSPFTRLSSTPYALNSAQLGGIDSDGFIQLAQGLQADDSATNESIYINKTGVAGIMRLQSSGADVFTLSNTGAALFRTSSNSTQAFRVQDNLSNTLFTISTDASSPVTSITSLAGGTQKSLVVNNSTSTGDIVDLQDNGTSVLRVTDGAAVVITGSLTSSGAAINLNNNSNNTTNINTGTSTGTINLGNTAATLVINSTGLKVTSAGAVTGVTTLTASAAISTAGNITTTGTGSITSATTITAGTGLTITTGNMAITGGLLSTNGVTRLTNAGALQNITGLTISSGGATVTSGNLALTAGLLSTNGVTRLTNAGALQNITALTLTGTTTLTGATTLSGGAVNINAGSGNNTNINTGASTGAVAIGNALSGFSVASTGFNVTGGGAVSGVSTLTTSGNINVTGTAVYQRAGQSGITLVCGSDQFIDQAIVSGGIITSSAGCANDTGGLSDQRLKTDITAVSGNMYEKMKEIDLVTFNFDCNHEYFTGTNTVCDQKIQTGVIAQQLQKVFPELVYEGTDGYLRVRYDALGIYTLKAVSELSEVLTTVDNKTTVSTGDSSGFSIVDADNQELLGLDSSGNLSIRGKLNVSKIAGLSDLIDDKIISLLDSGITVQGASSFVGTVSFEDVVTFSKKVAFNGRTTFAKDAGGFATIKQGAKEIDIEFSEEFDEPPVVQVNNADGQFVSFTYTELDEKGFKIILQYPAITDVNFSWTATAVKDAHTHISLSPSP